MVVEGEQGGVSNDVGWAGGGSFRVLEVAPSVFVDDPDSGTVALAPDAMGNLLAESIAANMTFAYEVDAPFCGRRGRERLAVVDGWLDDEIARYIAESLGERETVRIVATGFSDTARDALKAVSRGSTLKTIPQDLRSVRVRAAELQQAMVDRRAWEAEHAAELQQAMVDRRAWESEHASTVQPTLFSGLTAGDM
jgi:adenine-specific DNA-methyltransferase